MRIRLRKTAHLRHPPELPGQRGLVALFLDGLAPFLLRFVKRLLHVGGTVKRLQRLRGV